MSLQSICGKCKIAQLPCDLAVHVKVGDDYKIVCILQAWEIKRLTTNVQQQLATGGCSSSFLCVSPPTLHHVARRKDGVNSGRSTTQRIMQKTSQCKRCLTFRLVLVLTFILAVNPLSHALLDHVGCNCCLFKRLKVSLDNPPRLSCWHSA